MPLYDPRVTHFWHVSPAVLTAISAVMLAAKSSLGDTPTFQSEQNQQVSLPQAAKKTLSSVFSEIP